MLGGVWSLDILHFFFAYLVRNIIWSQIDAERPYRHVYMIYGKEKLKLHTHTGSRTHTHTFLFLKLFVSLSKIFFSFLGWDGAGTHAVTQRALALLRSDAGSTVGNVMECIASQEEYCQDIDFKAEAEKRQDINKILTPTWRDIFISNYIRVFYSILWLLRRCN